VPCISRPCLLIEVGPGAATCAMAPDPTSLLRWAPVQPHVPQLRTPPPYRDGLRCCHVPLGSGPCLPAWEGSSAATCLMALPPPRGESSGGTTCPTALSELWTIGIKKGLAALGPQLGLCISKTRLHVTKAPARCADMRCHHILQDVWIGCYSAAQRCSTTRLTTHMHGWQRM
jgi:hypothetical protein